MSNNTESLALDGGLFPEPEQKHRSRTEIYGRCKQRTVDLVHFLEENIEGYAKKVQKLLRKQYYKVRDCGQYLKFHHYYTVDQYRLVEAYFCKNKYLCALCGLRWSEKLVSECIRKAEQLMDKYPDLNLIFITLTVKNDEDIKVVYNRLDTGLKRMAMSMRDARRGKSSSEFGKIVGMFGSIEIKRGSGGLWHPHFHGLALVPGYFDWQKMVDEWLKKTGGSRGVYLEKIEHRDFSPITVCEVISYSLKVSTLSFDDQIEAYLFLRGKRLFRSWGVFRNIKLPDDLADDEISDLPYYELLYSFAYGKGYEINLIMEDSRVIWQKQGV
jgi:hypothetical protein